MPDERIETYINRSGIQGDTAFMLENLNAINDAFNKVNGIKLTLGKDNSFKAATVSAAELKKGIDNLGVSVESFKNIQADASKIVQQSASSYGSGSQAITKQATDLATLKLALQQNSALQKEYNKQLDEGKISLEDYQVKTAAAIISQKEYQASISSLNKELSSSVRQSAPIASTGTTVAINAEDDATNLKKTGDAVNALEREEAQAVIQAKEWAAAQRNAAIAAEEGAAAQKIALSPLEQTAVRLIEQRQAIGLNALAQSDLNTALSEGKITRDEWLASMSKSIIVENELKASVSELNKELSLAAKADLANPGSIRDAQANNLQLISERSSITAKPGLATPEDLQRIVELNALIDQNNELIDANSSKLEKQKINIGNYPTAFKVAFATLDDELGKVSASLQNKDLGAKEVADLTAKQGALKNATALVTQEFATTTAQTNAYKEAGKQVGQVYGADSQVFKDFAAQVAIGTAENKKLGDSLTDGASKGNRFTNALSSIFSNLRQIAYAIPGIGLAGLIGLLLDPFIAFASQLTKTKAAAVDANGELKNTAESLNDINDALEGSKGPVTKAIEDVDNMKNAFSEAREGIISQDDAVKLYNETLGKTAGSVDTLDQAEQKLAQNADAYIKFTLQKAAAQVAAQKAAEQLFQAEITRQKALANFGSITDVPTSSVGAGSVASGGPSEDDLQKQQEAFAKIEADQKARRAKAAKEFEDSAEEFRKIEEKFLTESNALAKQFHFFVDPKTTADQIKQQQQEFEEQIQVLDRYADKQKSIADDDRNTYEIRRQALLRYNSTLKEVLSLQTQSKLLGTTGDAEGGKVVYQQQLTAFEKLTIDSKERLRVIDETYRQRKLTADEQVSEDSLNQSEKENQAIYTDEQKSLEDRLAAYQAFVSAQQGILDIQKKEKLASVGFSPQEITDFDNGLQVQIQGKRITAEELKAIQVKYNTDSANLTANGAKQVYDIATSYAKQTEKDLAAINKSHLDSSVVDSFNEDMQALNKEYQMRLIGVIGFQQKRAQLEDQFTKAQLQAQINADNKSLAATEAVDQKELNEVREAAQNLINAKETGTQQEIDQNQSVLDALVTAEERNANLIKAIRAKLSADTKAQAKKDADDKEKIDAQNLQNEIKLAQTIVSSVQTIMDARYDNEKAQIQSAIDAINAKAQTDIAAENASADNAQDKADKIAVINQRATAQNAQLAAQQKKIDQDKARFDKEIAIMNIVINTAVAISNAVKSVGGVALIPIIAAIGAVEIATVAAQPLPTYKLGAGVNGRPKHPGGDAEVGHGKRELAITPDGRMIVTPSTPTVMNFPRDTVVLPDANAAIDALIYSSFRGLEHVEAPPADAKTLQAMQQLIKENRRLHTLIANKKEANLNVTWHGMEKSYRSGSNWMRYIDEKTNF